MLSRREGIPEGKQSVLGSMGCSFSKLEDRVSEGFLTALLSVSLLENLSMQQNGERL